MSAPELAVVRVRGALAVTLGLLAVGEFQAFRLARELGASAASLRWSVFFAAGGAAMLGMAALLALTWTSRSGWLLAWGRRAGGLLAGARGLHVPILILLNGAFPLMLIPPYPIPVSELLSNFWWRALVFWLVALAGAAILHARAPERGGWYALGASALVYGAAYRAATFLPDISTYPFSLTWSEASRYYYASLFFAEQVYGVPANPTVLHPTRYLLQAVPFLISGLPIWAHRAWQVGLWIGANALAAGLLARRVGALAAPGARSIPRYLVGAWAFLFLFQGPIWYHLVVMIILVLWGTDVRRFWRTLAVVALASAWGGMSRVNWIPFPAALAAVLYLLEREKGAAALWKYWFPPAAWGAVGVAAGLLAQSGYILWSGNDPALFGSAFSSDLLWYRLFPSATYPLGVLPGILLASWPVVWLGWVRLRGQWRPARAWEAIHPARWLGVAGALGVFFAGGLVVSAKIGGGSNLHNMDGYLALLMTAGAYAVFGKVRLEPLGAVEGAALPALPARALAAVVLIPVVFALDVGRAYDYDFVPRAVKVERALAGLEELVSQATAHGGEVLFISERQLLTFGYLEAPLVAEYEKVFLMEMALANHARYLAQFEADLRAHRFALIVTAPVQINFQDRERQFGEENNAWVEAVSFPLTCYYQQTALFKEVRVEVLAPRAEVACPALGGP